MARFANHDNVMSGKKPPDKANKKVKRTEPNIPVRKFRRPPKKSAMLPLANFASAYARTPREAIEPSLRRTVVASIPRETSSDEIIGSVTDKFDRQR